MILEDFFKYLCRDVKKDTSAKVAHSQKYIFL